ncbi:glycogen debranching N-terminal domain-containing protein [Micromonospora sp. WMMD1102]|uniref:amylo-alpha-1,6-glucosidase n=1 Tax=Micromonospora sp. WMMD1102 TaxID=3016105 RepID=UPI002414D406|nr:glycogen debranching N-terminal domain-containing protein [Micromonospora sp. WMMD1102]MDG4789465.1 glycogen debranching N-terminal domain-containing protein [Micromonospora sp. WMMD1102]
MRPLVSILDGNTFVVSDDRGDIDPSPVFPTGLFSFDTRFLSKWELTLDGHRLSVLSVDDLQYFESQFFLVPGEPTHYVDAKLSVIRHRTVGGSFVEDLTVLNHEDRAVELAVRINVESDFADLFEIKDVREKAGGTSVFVEQDRLRLCYQRETFRREAVITSTAPADFDRGGLSFTLRIGAHQQWQTRLRVETLVEGAGGRDIRLSIQRHRSRSPETLRRDLDEWMERAPKLTSDSEPLTETYRRSLIDLAALRYTPLLSGPPLPAAGLPWFMTMFGRDSLITCLQTLPFTPELAGPTLRYLAMTQGVSLDDFREREPGKILHEIRYGESTAFEEQPHSPYFGSADSTPLFVILLDEYEQWTGDVELVMTLEQEARAALNWIDRYADMMGNGYVWFERRNLRNGLENQCWKDSWDAISYSDGRLPAFPRATCELQGYAYDAKMRGARLARLYWQDPVYADRLEREAAELKQRFNRDFWVADGEYYALALDTEGGQVDALTSNMGHLLWSGIVDENRAAKVAEHLLGPRLFSGWGVRTMAEGEGRYNPIGYHVGTVWPFDNSLIAWGLRRYGFRHEAGRIAEAMIDAARYFGGRLPEAFAGYDRALTKYPVQYPTACSPQAWSTGTPMLLIRTLLGLDPHGEHLVVDPALPEHMGRMELLDIPGRWGLIDAFGRGRAEHGQTPPHMLD